MTVTLQTLTGDINLIVRVYETADTGEPAPYKFFTTAEIIGDTAHINGLKDAKITFSDLRCMGKELAVLGVARLTWTHKGRPHTFTIKQAKK